MTEPRTTFTVHVSNVDNIERTYEVRADFRSEAAGEARGAFAAQFGDRPYSLNVTVLD